MDKLVTQKCEEWIQEHGWRDITVQGEGHLFFYDGREIREARIEVGLKVKLLRSFKCWSYGAHGLVGDRNRKD